MSNRRLLAIIVLISSGYLIAPSLCMAVCNPLVPAKRVVGDTATDHNCTDNDIQSAINNTVCPNTTIYITGEHLYKSQHLLIQDKSLTLAGTTFPTCSMSIGTQGADSPDASGASTSPVITISGAGHTGDSVVSIHGNSQVTLQYLDITGGASDANQFGGGIYFGGEGSLTLDTTNVDHNFAGYGGGINVIGEGGNATITLTRSQILFNTAQYNGGGIRMEGTAHLFMLDPVSTIAFNQTIGADNIDPNGGHGGGIVIFGPAIADLASPAALLSNSATYGGGIAVISTSSGEAKARLFGVNGLTVGVLLNTASVAGGGGYVLSNSASVNTATEASLCASNFRIDQNTAPSGAAIYAGTSGTATNEEPSNVVFNDDPGPFGCNLSPSASSLGAQECSSPPCSEIAENNAVDSQGQPAGAVLMFDSFGFPDLHYFSMRENNAGQLISTAGSIGGYIDECLLVDNTTQHELIHEHENGFAMSDCTIAGNAIANSSVFYADQIVQLTKSIIWQPGKTSLDSVFCLDCASQVDYILANEIDSLKGFGDSLGLQLTSNPGFVDSANSNVDLRNYRLTAYVQNGKVTASRGIDAAPAGENDGPDLDGNTTDLDVPLVQDLSSGWIRDVGCYEAQPIVDRIFGDAIGDAMTLLK